MLFPALCCRPLRRNPKSSRWRDLVAVLLAANLASAGSAADAARRSFADMTIEELMNESVTSVSKKETRLADSPAAVSVVTAEDIRRRGITNLAEALRFAPGLDVGRINGNQWAISARGFNFLYANKLLVLMDGRTLYTPMFGGVFWDVADTPLEDLDRIEIIRGPGATLWGANAVNGVINVMTKSARETQGTLLSTNVGSSDRFGALARYGGRAGQNFFYRAYVKYDARAPQANAAGGAAHDAAEMVRTGARADWTDAGNAFTLQADYHQVHGEEDLSEVMLTPPFERNLPVRNDSHGAYALGRWTHTFSPTSEFKLQSYFDHSLHVDGGTNQTRDTGDIDFQHRFGLDRHDIVWGVGYRYNADEIPPSPIVVWTPASRTTRLQTAFVQDQIALTPDRLALIVGSKFERDDSRPVKAQPSARLLWTPSRTRTAWAAVSRAFKTPARFDTDARLNISASQPSPLSPVVELALLGSPAVRVEEVRAYEVGYRFEPTPRWSFDFASFYNQYSDLIGYTAGTPQFEPTPTPHLLVPLLGGNGLHGQTYGAELAMQWQASDRWRLAGNYTLLKARIRPDPSLEGDSPQHQFHLHASWQLARAWELNGTLSHVGSLTNSITYEHVPAYTRLDLGLVWHPNPTIDAGVWGQNLLDAQHREMDGLNASIRGEIRRSVTARVTWRL